MEVTLMYYAIEKEEDGYYVYALDNKHKKIIRNTGKAAVSYDELELAFRKSVFNNDLNVRLGVRPMLLSKKELEQMLERN